MIVFFSSKKYNSASLTEILTNVNSKSQCEITTSFEGPGPSLTTTCWKYSLDKLHFQGHDYDLDMWNEHTLTLNRASHSTSTSRGAYWTGQTYTYSPALTNGEI